MNKFAVLYYWVAICSLALSSAAAVAQETKTKPKSKPAKICKNAIIDVSQSVCTSGRQLKKSCKVDGKVVETATVCIGN